jgi:hypothetical protein
MLKLKLRRIFSFGGNFFANFKKNFATTLGVSSAIINKNIVFDGDLVSIEFLFKDNGVRRLTLK